MSLTLRLLLLAALLAAALVQAGRTWGHQAPSGWTYPEECCSGHNDCAEIPASAVRGLADGWHVDLPAGIHPRGFPVRQVFPYRDEKLRRSGDGQFHLCVRPNGQVLCLYVPPGAA